MNLQNWATIIHATSQILLIVLAVLSIFIETVYHPIDKEGITRNKLNKKGKILLYSTIVIAIMVVIDVVVTDYTNNKHVTSLENKIDTVSIKIDTLNDSLTLSLTLVGELNSELNNFNLIFKALSEQINKTDSLVDAKNDKNYKHIDSFWRFSKRKFKETSDSIDNKFSVSLNKLDSNFKQQSKSIDDYYRSVDTKMDNLAKNEEVQRLSNNYNSIIQIIGMVNDNLIELENNIKSDINEIEATVNWLEKSHQDLNNKLNDTITIKNMGDSLKIKFIKKN